MGNLFVRVLEERSYQRKIRNENMSNFNMWKVALHENGASD
jgi:hypothetical protein